MAWKAFVENFSVFSKYLTIRYGLLLLFFCVHVWLFIIRTFMVFALIDNHISWRMHGDKNGKWHAYAQRIHTNKILNVRMTDRKVRVDERVHRFQLQNMLSEETFNRLPFNQSHLLCCNLAWRKFHFDFWYDGCARWHQFNHHPTHNSILHFYISLIFMAACA